MLRQADRQYYYRDYKVNIFQPIAPTHSVQTAIGQSNLNLSISTESHTHSCSDKYITHTHSIKIFLTFVINKAVVFL